jgi:hypothetical protein
MMVDGCASNEGCLIFIQYCFDGFGSNDGLMDFHPMLVS